MNMERNTHFTATRLNLATSARSSHDGATSLWSFCPPDQAGLDGSGQAALTIKKPLSLLRKQLNYDARAISRRLIS